MTLIDRLGEQNSLEAMSTTQQAERRSLIAVSTFPPWPDNNGFSLRILKLLQCLSRTWNVTLLAPAPLDAADGQVVKAPFEFLPMPISGNGLNYAWRFDATSLKEFVANVVRDRRPSVALLFCGAEGIWFDRPDFPRAVGDRIDCCTLEFWQRMWSARGLRRFASEVREMVISAMHERRAVRDLAATVVVGEKDASILEWLSGRPVDIVTNGVDLPEVNPTSDENARPTVIFTGRLDYGPNVDAAVYGARKVWPMVRAGAPTARMVIAGRMPLPEVVQLQSEQGVEVLADVADMSAQLRSAWVAIAPMRVGVGVKNKVLEAWACAKPVVMTKLATNGLSMPAGASAFVADSPEALAKAVLHLFADGKLRRNAGDLARALVADKFSWKRVSGQLDEVLRRVCNQDAQRP